MVVFLVERSASTPLSCPEVRKKIWRLGKNSYIHRKIIKNSGTTSSFPVSYALYTSVSTLWLPRVAWHRSCAVAALFSSFSSFVAPFGLHPFSPGGTRAVQTFGPARARARVAALPAIPNQSGIGNWPGTWMAVQSADVNSTSIILQYYYNLENAWHTFD